VSRPRLLAKLAPAPAPDLELSERATTGQRWRFRRNLVIVLAHRHGASQRLLADVFDLPHSRICAIVKEFRAKYGEG
jgi:hypothetical protein